MKRRRQLFLWQRYLQRERGRPRPQQYSRRTPPAAADEAVRAPTPTRDSAEVVIGRTSIGIFLMLALMPAVSGDVTSFGPVGPLGDHRYEVVLCPPLSWEAANQAARIRGGHLVTITTQAEDELIEILRQTALQALLNIDPFDQENAPELWIGGFQLPDQSTVDAGWQWVNEEGPIPGNNSGPAYANWRQTPAIEPNDAVETVFVEDNEENHIAIGRFGESGWIDEFGELGGYVVEYRPDKRLPTPNVDGLLAWLKADAGLALADGQVISWTDQSAHQFEFMPPTLDQRPTFKRGVQNGLPAISFNGTQQLNAALETTLSEATILGLYRYTVESSDNDYVYAMGVPGASGSMMTLSRRDGSQVYHYDGSIQNVVPDTSIPGARFEVLTQVYGDRGASSHDLFQNQRWTVTTDAANPYSVDANTFVLGNYVSGSFNFVGEIIELLVYDRALPVEERAAVEDYLRLRAGFSPLTAEDSQVLTNWEIVQYQFNSQGDARWAVDLSQRRVDQLVNSDPSIFLGNFDSANTVITGNLGSGNAPDYMGFVFGYQGRGNYYLFDWKKTTAEWFGLGHQGMRLRVIETVDGNDPNGFDLWQFEDTANVRTLRHNDIPWVEGVDYHFTLRYAPPQINLEILEGNRILESWSLNDGTFSSGPFGYYINSLADVRFGEVIVHPLEVQSDLRITRQPSGQTLPTGAVLTLAVEVVGAEPIQFEWRRNGIKIEGATQSTLTFDAVQPSDSGLYTVSVRNPLGTIESEPARVNIETPEIGFADNIEDGATLTRARGRGATNNEAASIEINEPEHGEKQGGKSVWINWTAPATGIVTMDTAGSDFDTLLSVYTGTVVEGLNLIGSSDDAGRSLTSEIIFNAQADQAYRVAVDGFHGAAGNIILNWDLQATDEMLPEIIIPMLDIIVGTGSDVELNITAAGNALSYEWFHNDQLKPASNTPTLSLSGVAMPDVGEYRVRVTSGTRWVDRSARLELNQTDQTTQEVSTTIKFGDAFVNSGQVGLLVAASLRPLAAGGSVASGFTGSQIFDTFGAIKEPGEPNHCGVFGGASMWFAYQPPESGMLTIDTNGSEFDTVLAVYTAIGVSFADLNLVACDNNSALDGRDSQVTFEATGETIYYIVVDGVNGETGLVNLNYSLESSLILVEPMIGVVGEFGFEFRVLATSGVTFDIQKSTDLKQWETVDSGSGSEEGFTFNEAVLQDLRALFYRAIRRN